MGGKDLELLKAKAQGRWHEILLAYGIEVSRNPKETSGCPVCGDGRNNHRFRFDNIDGQGTWYCQQCRAGDGFSLLIKTGKATGFFNAIEMVERVVGEVPSTDDGGKSSYDHRKLMNDIWAKSEVLTGSDIACNYLRARGLDLKFIPTNVRFSPECYESESKMKRPAMIALVHDRDGKPVTLHRTYLDKDGTKKADIQAPRKLMKGVTKLNCVNIRLCPTKGGLLGVGEGIDTALACLELFNIPTWSAINTTLMETWEPPGQPEIKDVVIFGDNDMNYSGHRAACTLANKLVLQGYKVKIKIPPKPGTDWLDVLSEKKKGK